MILDILLGILLLRKWIYFILKCCMLHKQKLSVVIWQVDKNSMLNGQCFLNFYFFSKPQQYKLAKYCEEIFEDYLLKKPLDSIPVRFYLFIFDFCFELYIMLIGNTEQSTSAMQIASCSDEAWERISIFCCN